jgi:hypothetical protein
MDRPEAEPSKPVGSTGTGMLERCRPDTQSLIAEGQHPLRVKAETITGTSDCGPARRLPDTRCAVAENRHPLPSKETETPGTVILNRTTPARHTMPDCEGPTSPPVKGD